MPVYNKYMKLTGKALDYVASIIPEGHHLRIKVVGGGCSGLSYKMEFVTDSTENDSVLGREDAPFNLIIDKKSMLFLKDVEIDYTDGLSGVGFTFKNPMAKSTCGCGTSFSS